MTAYYNEIDPQAAAWLRELIRQGHIAPGDVDERDIRDVRPTELDGYTQCHFFAGIGVWSYALRQAGWPDDKPVWTGSCPCQPFSAAGRRSGTTDERHLWPHWLHLISECNPRVVFGEQVASKDGLGWLDLVQADLEGAGYASGAVDLCAAGFGAPHIRQRSWFVGERVDNANSPRLEGHAGNGGTTGRQGPRGPVAEAGVSGGVGNSESVGREGREPVPYGQGERRVNARTGANGGMANADRSADRHPGPTNGLWRAADWLLCRDGKWRPTSPFPQPLADGAAESLGRVCDSRIEALEEEINAAAVEAESQPAALLRDLRRALEAEAPRVWTPGRIPGLHEAPFLLAFLRQLTEQRRGISQCLFVSSEEAPKEGVRGVRADNGTPRTSCQRGLEGQQAGEHSDVVRLLSPILARHTQEAWGTSYQAYAESCFVLASGAAARVGRLRGYGNAINAEAAAAFIAACMEAAAEQVEALTEPAA